MLWYLTELWALGRSINCNKDLEVDKLKLPYIHYTNYSGDESHGYSVGDVKEVESVEPTNLGQIHVKTISFPVANINV
ncbi:hypothetical protein Tco_1455383, partial [Tanacetum coccineum]